ncbi:hypothetical protein [uncultured Ruminococcus sp.]|uniref:hypothetical protein n=1 Tax=uncultured Ruminococcus sp. TaxID=165186 RepID=UPI0025D99342|nr:hypothetical protein [uncultured Ruminococcus sp.]
MNYKSFMKSSACLCRKSYYISVIIPSYENRSLSELEFYHKFSHIVTEETDGRMLTVYGIGVKVSTGDFWQLNDIENIYIHIEDVLNSTDDTIGVD